MLAGIIITLFAGVVIIDYIPNRRSRKRKENIFYGVVLAVSFFTLLLYSLQMTLPNPTTAIENIVKLVVPIK